MYDRMLIPVDAPNEVEPLIRFAAALLNASGEIRVLHVIPAGSLPEVTRKWRSSVNLVVPAHEAGASLDINVEPQVRSAPDVAGEILESAETHGVDAILMTLRGNRRSRLPFVGHVSSSVLHHAHSDVIIVNRLALLEEKIPRLLLPAIGGVPSPKAVSIAEELSLRHEGIPTVILGIATRGSEGEGGAPMMSRSPRGLSFERRVSDIPSRLLGRRGRLPELILQMAARERFGLLIVGESAAPHESPILTRRFLEDLFRSAPCPVLAIRG